MHLCTINSIEPDLASVRVRTGLTKGPGSRAEGVATIFKPLEATERRWRPINGYELTPLSANRSEVRQGTTSVSNISYYLSPFGHRRNMFAKSSTAE